MTNPLEGTAARVQRYGFFVALVGTILLMSILNVLGGPLTTEAAPFGIVSFELAFSQTSAQAILLSWDTNATLLAAFTLGLDYLFMVFYAAAIYFGVLLSRVWLAVHQLPFSRWGAWLAWGALAAAGLDAVENMALVVQLIRGPGQTWAVLAGFCATVKFGLIFLGIVYGFYTLTMRLVYRWLPAGDSLN